MKRFAVQSTDVRSIGWHSDTDYVTQDSVGTLEVQFRKNGAVYQYFNVPVFVYHGVRYAHSIGRALHALVKRGGYDYKQVS